MAEETQGTASTNYQTLQNMQTKAFDHSFHNERGKPKFDNIDDLAKDKLKTLSDTRTAKISKDVENEFKDKERRRSSRHRKTSPGRHSTHSSPRKDEESFRDADCVILESQMQVMEDIFVELDKYNDGILKRQDFVHAL